MTWLSELLFPRRLHRLAFFFRSLAVSVVASILYAGSTTMNPLCWWSWYILGNIYSAFYILLPRMRDVGMSGWWLIPCLIPGVDALIGVILLFRAPNYYQKPTFSRTTTA
jgi:uncharacterized membrane protein YhaH (DUF805 family)